MNVVFMQETNHYKSFLVSTEPYTTMEYMLLTCFIQFAWMLQYFIGLCSFEFQSKFKVTSKTRIMDNIFTIQKHSAKLLLMIETKIIAYKICPSPYK